MDDARNPEFDALFDECLSDVLRGVRTIDECVSQHPHFADDLRPALQAGVLTERLKSPAMSNSSIEMLEMRLRAHMQIHTQSNGQTEINALKIIQPNRTFWLPISRAAALFLVVFFVALGSGAGAVAASANSVPGDWLYGLKRLWEAIVLALTPLTGQADDLYLTIAEHRLDEVEALAQRNQLSQDALRDLHNATAQAITLADADTLPYVLAYLDDANRRLEVIQADPTVYSLYAGVRAITTPVFSENGLLRSQPTLPADLAVMPVSMTATPILEPSATQPEVVANTETATPTVTPSITPTTTQTSTPTPRVPATATRTTTPTVTPTVTPSVTPSATYTWTPLPIPTLPPQTPVVRVTNTPVRNNGGGSNTEEPGEQATVRYRETEMSVYLTQTAGPQQTDAP